MPLPWSSTISQYIILQREKFQDNHISGLVFAPFLLVLLAILVTGEYGAWGARRAVPLLSAVVSGEHINFLSLPAHQSR